MPRSIRRSDATTRHSRSVGKLWSVITDFSALGALAGLYAERGEMVEADRWLIAARYCYHGVSPFPLAVLDFQCGQMWMEHNDLGRARAWCDAAVRRVPAYVLPTQGHLAEIEAALGERAAAIARQRALALASDDPDYATYMLPGRECGDMVQ